MRPVCLCRVKTRRARRGRRNSSSASPLSSRPLTPVKGPCSPLSGEVACVALQCMCEAAVLPLCPCARRSGESHVTAEKGALALLEMATAMGAGATAGTGALSFSTRARAIGAVFKLLPAGLVDSIYP